jgi:hypothetical protein
MFDLPEQRVTLWTAHSWLTHRAFDLVEAERLLHCRSPIQRFGAPAFLGQII